MPVLLGTKKMILSDKFQRNAFGKCLTYRLYRLFQRPAKSVSHIMRKIEKRSVRFSVFLQEVLDFVPLHVLFRLGLISLWLSEEKNVVLQ